MDVTGNINFDRLNISNNDIDKVMVKAISDSGSLVIKNTIIESNARYEYGEILSMISLMNIENISSASISNVEIKENQAQSYMIFDGTLSGNVTIESCIIEDNDNIDGTINDLIGLNQFMDAIISDTNLVAMKKEINY